MNATQAAPGLQTPSRVIHWAFWYDVLLKVLTVGRERAFREKFLEVVRPAPGEAILDAGCGTGTLAIAAKHRVGARGEVFGIDAGAEMIERARRKAARAGVTVTFEPALLEAIPFPDGKFDVVMTSLVLHHLPDDLRPRCIAEMRRVLKPGGRLVAFDFGGSHSHHWLFRRSHPHQAFRLDDVIPAIRMAGFSRPEQGLLGRMRIAYVRAFTPGAS